MSDTDTIKPPGWFWAVAILFLLWSLTGVFACYSQLSMTPEQLAALPAQQRDAFTAMPGFIQAAYGVAVLSGLLGSILLIARKALAKPAFILSLLGVIGQFGWFFGPYQGLEKMGASSAAFPAFIAIVCVVEIWFATMAARKGWIG